MASVVYLWAASPVMPGLGRRLSRDPCLVPCVRSCTTDTSIPESAGGGPEDLTPETNVDWMPKLIQTSGMTE